MKRLTIRYYDDRDFEDAKELFYQWRIQEPTLSWNEFVVRMLRNPDNAPAPKR